MEESNSLIEQRKSKLAGLRRKGINPFANKFLPTEGCGQTRANYFVLRWTTVALAIQVVLAAALIPVFGAAGAAASVAIGEAAIWWPLQRANPERHGLKAVPYVRGTDPVSV